MKRVGAPKRYTTASAPRLKESDTIATQPRRTEQVLINQDGNLQGVPTHIVHVTGQVASPQVAPPGKYVSAATSQPLIRWFYERGQEKKRNRCFTPFCEALSHAIEEAYQVYLMVC